MLFTIIGKDYITVNEKNLKDDIISDKKIHLIKIDIKNPDFKTIEAITILFPNTNRFVISSSSNIKIYNEAFKKIVKKYYIENDTNYRFVSFLRKNNKILFNYCNLNTHDKKFVDDKDVLGDILWNCEVFACKTDFYEKWKNVFSRWSGNLIIL